VLGEIKLFLYFDGFIDFIGVGCDARPLVLTQAQQLVARLPEWIDSGQHQLMVLNDWLRIRAYRNPRCPGYSNQ